MAVAALALTACNKDQNDSIEIPNGEIRLSSGVTVQTKASFGMDTQIPSNQQVAVYVDKAADASPIYGNNVLTADGRGGFSGGKTMYFPADKSSVDIYAFRTNESLGDNYPETPITHTVRADQRIADNYAASDLLYGAKKGVAFTKQTVELTFYHMLSKVEVALKVGTGTPNLEGATVSIVGTKLKADFEPDKMRAMPDQDARARMITPTDADNKPAEITISNTVSANFGDNISYNEAIIVPQVVAKDAKWIQVTLASGGELFYKLPRTTTFESGKKYSYKITVNLTGLTVTSTIADWDAVGEVGGDAEMEMPAKVGDFYMNDGTWLPGSTNLTEEQQAACIGIVYWTGDPTTDDLALKNDYPNCTHGLVVALTEVRSLWQLTDTPFNTTVNHWTTAHATGFTQPIISGGQLTDPINQIMGYNNTEAILAFNAAPANSVWTVEAIEKVKDCRTSTPNPASSSPWFIPSTKELTLLCGLKPPTNGNVFDDGYGTGNRDAMNTQLAKVSGATKVAPNSYWSSSENNYYGSSWYVNFDEGITSNTSKSLTCQVRCVRAF